MAACCMNACCMAAGAGATRHADHRHPNWNNLGDQIGLEIGENRHIEHVGMDSMDTLPPRGNVRLPHQGVLGRKSAVVPKIAPDRPKKSREALSEAVRSSRAGAGATEKYDDDASLVGGAQDIGITCGAPLPAPGTAGESMEQARAT
eukprot:CAMPEP_0118966750 /NCGR_PEP_ID=MMETSP1173-20130426/4210_1 /TAXON_ID=1034831 /ORGANISM="Rhizochromulina marina cf, Strain CCMP1243" /LENGTH=146 /DNA_ID=CAMNT_0006915597 /DNA_START=187 /DNA_END=629 /DNA_ORIENTATION=-